MGMRQSFINALMIVASFWAIFIVSVITDVDFTPFGILPRHSEGIKGILFAPFIHGSFAHLISNTIPMLVLTTVIFWMYRKIAFRVLLLSILMGGLLVWIFGRSTTLNTNHIEVLTHHIGASGVIFALVGFLIASGIFRKKIKALMIAVAIFFLYGGIIWGVLPTQPGVSWEGHLFGFISGVVLAYIFKDSES
jgi:membrane associated rhomboid family serine protease